MMYHFLAETAVTIALCPHRYTKLKIPKFLEQKGQDVVYTLVFESWDLDLKWVSYGRITEGLPDSDNEV